VTDPAIDGDTAVALRAEDTARIVTRHVALILSLCVVIQGALGGIVVFYPPQDWNLLNSIVQALKELSFMIAGGWLALLRPSGGASASATTPGAPPTPEMPAPPPAGGTAHAAA
jgi:hypothetical protein